MIKTENWSSTERSFEFIGWKNYKEIKKKAMEQEFSWTGLLISLSIAFFIVLSIAHGLSLLVESIEYNAYNQEEKNKITETNQKKDVFNLVVAVDDKVGYKKY